MKVYFYRRKNGLTNFGDEINPWMWEKLLPGVFDDDDSTLFLGIGTLLNTRLPKARRIVIFGSGVGYGKTPAVEQTWKVYCLRGPLSAEALKLDSSLAVADPAILVRRLYNKPTNKTYRYSFMPHWRNATPEIERVCRDIGFGYVDPGWPVEQALTAIAETETMVTEAMHGAIVADALRVPWVSLSDKENASTLDFKWRDFCLSMKVDYDPHPFPHIWKLKNTSLIGRLRHSAKRIFVARELRRIARTARPTLSAEAHIDALTDELENRLDQFKQDYAAGNFC